MEHIYIVKIPNLSIRNVAILLAIPYNIAGILVFVQSPINPINLMKST